MIRENGRMIVSVIVAQIVYAIKTKFNKKLSLINVEIGCWQSQNKMVLYTSWLLKRQKEISKNMWVQSFFEKKDCFAVLTKMSSKIKSCWQTRLLMINYQSCRVEQRRDGRRTFKNFFQKWKKLLTNEFESDIVNKLSLETNSNKAKNIDNWTVK